MLDITVDGMTCNHCVRAVTAAVEALPGVAGVTVDLPSGRVCIDGDADLGAVTSAIEDEGYHVRPAASP